MVQRMAGIRPRSSSDAGRLASAPADGLESATERDSHGGPAGGAARLRSEAGALRRADLEPAHGRGPPVEGRLPRRRSSAWSATRQRDARAPCDRRAGVQFVKFVPIEIRAHGRECHPPGTPGAPEGPKPVASRLRALAPTLQPQARPADATAGDSDDHGTPAAVAGAGGPRSALITATCPRVTTGEVAMRIYRVLRGLTLPCECLVGIYETFDGSPVAIVDQHATLCRDLSHRVGSRIGLAQPETNAPVPGPPGFRAALGRKAPLVR